jgi:hypothetical protein
MVSFQNYSSEDLCLFTSLPNNVTVLISFLQYEFYMQYFIKKIDEMKFAMSLRNHRDQQINI